MLLREVGEPHLGRHRQAPALDAVENEHPEGTRPEQFVGRSERTCHVRRADHGERLEIDAHVGQVGRMERRRGGRDPRAGLTLPLGIADEIGSDGQIRTATARAELHEAPRDFGVAPVGRRAERTLPTGRHRASVAETPRGEELIDRDRVRCHATRCRWTFVFRQQPRARDRGR